MIQIFDLLAGGDLIQDALVGVVGFLELNGFVVVPGDFYVVLPKFASDIVSSRMGRDLFYLKREG